MAYTDTGLTLNDQTGNVLRVFLSEGKVVMFKLGTGFFGIIHLNRLLQIINNKKTKFVTFLGIKIKLNELNKFIKEIYKFLKNSALKRKESKKTKKKPKYIRTHPARQIA